MSRLAISDLDDAVMDRLRVRAERHGRSPEDEARLILTSAFQAPPAISGNVAEAIAAITDAAGGLMLDLPERPVVRATTLFADWQEA